MKLKSKRALQVFLASVVVLISCDVSTFAAAPQMPTPIPGAINLIVAQTAAAAATETAVMIPPTLTPTLTPFPTQTPPNTPTATPTFIFFFSTLTPSGNPNSGGTYSCSLVSQSPDDKTNFSLSQSFRLNWNVQNTGTSSWSSTNVTLDYVSGKKFTNETTFNLPSTIAPGSSIALTISMTAPGTKGDYTTNWTLSVNSQPFCALFLRIIVK